MRMILGFVHRFDCRGCLRRMPLALLSLVALLALAPSIPAQAQVTHWFDNFNDMDATDGNPMTWDPNPHVTIPLLGVNGRIFVGDYNATTGDYRLAGQDMQILDSDDEILIADAGETTFSGGVSVRTRARIDDLGAAGVGANNLFPLFVGYYGVYHLDKDDGILGSYYEVGRLDPTVGLIKFVEDDNPKDEFGNPIYPPSVPPELPVDGDVIVQLDVFDPEIRFTVWAPGQPQPAPQVIVTDNSGFAFLTEGTAGLVFNEDAFEGIEQGTGTFRWAKAAGALLLDGDMDVDGDVDFDDIDDFVQGLNNPAAYEAARGLPPNMLGDTDNDGDLDFDDIGNFVAALGGAGLGGSAGGLVVPEPSAAVLLIAGGLLALVPLRKRR